MNPQQAYAEAAVTVSDPDHTGFIMYQGVVRECYAMSAAIAEEDWAALVRAGTHAQQILAAFHDLADRSTSDGERFRLSNLWAWTEVQAVLQHHDAARVESVRTWAEALAEQLYRRLTGAAVEAVS
jgi:flagellin-specific chaperone FliS